jgi:hypothetical protein
VGTGKASHLCAVLHESANNNPHVIMIMFHFITDYTILSLSICTKYRGLPSNGVYLQHDNVHIHSNG